MPEMRLTAPSIAWLTVLLLAGLLLSAGCRSGRPQSGAAGAKAKLTADQALALATRLANEAFAKTRFVDARGKPIPTVVLSPGQWRVAEREDGRWVFLLDRPVGPQARVAFDLDGSDPRVYVGYALE